jgi:hypothetical protein
MFIDHLQLLDLVLQKSLNISGVPFDTADSNQDGRIVGGTPTTIENNPHQVKLLNCCRTVFAIY